MDNGFITLHRKITEWEWYDDINTFRVFLHLLLTANWKDTKWHGVKILRGQRVISYAGLAEESHLSVRAVRTCLERLKSTGEVTCQSTRRYTIVTLVNYNKYQDKETDETTHQTTHARHTPDKQTTHERQQLNKDNKDNKETSNNKPPIIPLENFSPLLTEKIQEWLTYKKERNQNYKPTGLKSLLAQIKNNADKYGDEAVAEVITSSMASNYQGIVFDRLKQQTRGQPKNNSFMDTLADIDLGEVIDI
jgi:predicted transcriptional regulator